MRVTMISIVMLMLLSSSTGVAGQDYSVTDIDCQYGGNAENGVISAKLSKPEGFQGVQLSQADTMNLSSIAAVIYFKEADRARIRLNGTTQPTSSNPKVRKYR